MLGRREEEGVLGRRESGFVRMRCTVCDTCKTSVVDVPQIYM